MATTTLYITHRRMDYLSHGGKHISSVKLLDGSVLTRQQVLDRMRQGQVFYTYVPSTRHQARVHPMRCTHCGTTYITTSADAFKDDNLDHLPLF